MPAERRQKSIYCLALEIENLRCFAETQELHLVDSSGRPARWTLLVGDNGVGKTTLLQCLAWMLPVPYYRPGESTPAGVVPRLDEQDTSDIAKLLRDGARSTTLRAEMVEIPTLASGLPSTARVNTEITLRARNNTLEDVQPTRTERAKTVEPFVIAYAANRYMGKHNAAKLSKSELDDLLSADRTELVDPADVLSGFDYSARMGNAKSKALLDRMKQALADILPFIDTADAIELLDPVERNGGLRFSTQYGKVPLDGLSLGHRTVTAWTVDLAWRLVNHYPESANPLEEPAVVLIDEIDLHLHPRWQRRIMKQFSDHFANVQFVATAHSPLMITSVSDINVAVLRQTGEGDQVGIENDPGVVEGWRFDQILVNLFGLETARSLRIERLMEEREDLLGKISATEPEKARVREITEQLSSLPTEERPEDEAAMQIIRRAAAEIKAREEEPS